MKILYIDIETTDTLMRKWDPYRDGAPNVIVEDWKVLGFCYAWDDGPVKSVYPTKANRRKGGYYREFDAVAAAKARDLIDEADVLIAHNGDRFDIRNLKGKMVQHGLTPPSHLLSIDTMKICRREFGFPRNNLDYIGELLGFGGKIHHSGYDMWTGCMEGRSAAWDEMEEYNVRDVELLRNVYKRIQPYDTRHPNLGEGHGCPGCKSLDLARRGVRHMKSGLTRQRWQCNNCGRYSTSLKNGDIRL